MYIHANQHWPDNDDDGELEYTGTGNEELTDDVRLPLTFIHSPAWAAANVSDCLVLQKTYGSPTLFIMFTTNPTWPEIMSQLLPGQTAADHPDIIVWVFHQKLAAFEKEIIDRLGPVKYSIHIMEFQKRGPPHGHVAVKLKDVPCTAAKIDQFLSAELSWEHGPLHDAVKKHMSYQHDPKREYHHCGWSATSQKCQYNYPHAVKSESGFNECGRF